MVARAVVYLQTAPGARLDAPSRRPVTTGAFLFSTAYLASAAYFYLVRNASFMICFMSLTQVYHSTAEEREERMLCPVL